MPDNVNLLKICAILAAGAISVSAAARFTENYAAEAAFREKTLAEAVMQNQLQAELKKAEEQAIKELEEQGQTLVTTVLETKPPVTEPPPEETTVPETSTEAETTETTVPEPEITEIFTETATSVSETEPEPEEDEDEIITQFTRGGLLPTDRKGLPIRSMFLLTEDQQTEVIDFLVEHYFLDGYKYSEAETRPELKEKKKLAADMESGVVGSLNLVMGSMNFNDITAILSADYTSMAKEIKATKKEFEETYKDAYKYGEHFADLYDNSLKYFDRLIKALETLGDTAKQYREATNPLLALGLLTSSIDNVVIPEIMGVLEESFGLVEASQEIFLEGTVGTQLLTRDEVTDIILNPALVLDTGLAKK